MSQSHFVNYLRQRSHAAGCEGRHEHAQTHGEIADRLEYLEAMAAASPTIAAAFEFLHALDANARAKALAFGMAGYDQYATSFPGPDFFDSTAKATARPHVEVAIRNAINDLCGGA